MHLPRRNLHPNSCTHPPREMDTAHSHDEQTNCLSVDLICVFTERQNICTRQRGSIYAHDREAEYMHTRSREESLGCAYLGHLCAAVCLRELNANGQVYANTDKSKSACLRLSFDFPHVAGISTSADNRCPRQLRATLPSSTNSHSHSRP